VKLYIQVCGMHKSASFLHRRDPDSKQQEFSICRCQRPSYVGECRPANKVADKIPIGAEEAEGLTSRIHG